MSPVSPRAPGGSEGAGGSLDEADEARLRSLVRDVPGFPKPGILFKDLTPLLGDAGALAQALGALTAFGGQLGADYVIAPEARGFLLGPTLALSLGAGFVPARKPGLLPRESARVEYSLEYASDCLEAHVDSFAHGSRVLIHDDLLATGGTAGALAELVGLLGGDVVGACFLIELEALNGRTRLAGIPVHSLLRYAEP